MVNTLPGRRYPKSVYELVLEASNTLGRNGRVFSAYDVIRYIRSKYPDCPYSDNSFKMHIQALSKNNKHAPKRWPSLYKRAFLIHLGGEKYKLAPTRPEEEKPVEQPPIQETPETSYSLSLERDLEDYLANNLEEIEPGLKLVERQKHLPNLGRLDILAKDNQGNHVVIELKAGEADEKAVGQLTAYMEYLKEQGYDKIRGILVAASYTPKAIYAAKANAQLKLVKYEVKFKISNVI